MIRERIALIIFAGALCSPLHSEIYRWDTGQLIPGTEGITPGPGAQLDRRFLEFANLSQQDLSRATFAWSNLTDASFIGSPLTATDFTNARIVGARFSSNLAKEQLYSTRSYRDRDLTGITIVVSDLSGWNFHGQNLTNANLRGSNLDDADFRDAVIRGLWSNGLSADQLYSTRSYKDKILTAIEFAHNAFEGAIFEGQSLTECSFSGSTLRGANFRYANIDHTSFSASDVRDVDFTEAKLFGALFDQDLSGAIFEDADIKGTSFHSTLSQTQLYSTASHKERNLEGVSFSGDLRDWNFSRQNLTLGGFENAMLTGANFADAIIAGARFGDENPFGLTKEQLYSTRSYRMRELPGIRFKANYIADPHPRGMDLSGWDFSHQNLMGSVFAETNIEGADFRFADLRATADPFGINLWTPQLAAMENAILADGRIDGLFLDGGDRLVVRNFDVSGFGPIPINVRGAMVLAPASILELRFAQERWRSTISFDEGIQVQLGGQLELTFSDDVDVATQIDRSFHIFDWTGVSPTGRFRVPAAHAWDLSNLYTTGEVRLVAVPGDFNGDQQLTVADLQLVADAVRTQNVFETLDLTGDGTLDPADLAYWVHELKRTSFGDANLDGQFDSSDLVQVFQAGQYEDTLDDNSGWATGDWNVDRDFTSADLVFAFQDGGYEQGPQAVTTAVPEPAGSLLLLLSAAAVVLRGYKRG